MGSNQENINNNCYLNYHVPDLMVTNYNMTCVQNDPNYIANLNNPKLFSDDVYFSAHDFDEDYEGHFVTKGIDQLADNINKQEDYRYSNNTAASNVFQRYLVIMSNLKDLLLPRSDGTFNEKWILIAMDFQKNCEDIFLRFVKTEYILAFLPMVPKQLEYTSMKLKEIPLMSHREQENFKNLFSLIALGFVGKMKLLSFYISLTLERGSVRESNLAGSGLNKMGAEEHDMEHESAYHNQLNATEMEIFTFEAQHIAHGSLEFQQPFREINTYFETEKSQSCRTINTRKRTLEIKKNTLEDSMEEEHDVDWEGKIRKSPVRRGRAKRFRGRRGVNRATT